jgi:hypothetical protein
MKNWIWPILVLALTALACKALVPAAQVRTSTPVLQESPVSKATSIIPSPVRTQVPLATISPLPSLQPITCTDDSCVEACLQQRMEYGYPPTDQPLSGVYAENAIEVNLVDYDIRDGQLGEPQFLHVPDAFQVYQQDTAAQEALWNYASSLLTPDELKWINQFEIFSSTIYSGWVKMPGDDWQQRSHWTLGMEQAYAQNPAVATYTLVHEYGHLITMNTDQIPASGFYYGWYQNSAVCKQFLSPAGCSKPDSYVNQFYQAFWKDIFDEWLKEVGVQVVHNSEEMFGLEKKFYNEHQDLFLVEHAAENIYEDMAASFTFFVLSPRPTGDSVVEQKIRFFYNYPELVALRQHMIRSICSYSGQ